MTSYSMLFNTQPEILRDLAKSVAIPGCLFLEIGSWLGDSSGILGLVAKEYSGHVVCIDWWKGNIGEETQELAVNRDIQSEFWKGVISLGLQDTIIPIRGDSRFVHRILRGSFDLIFIDGDHAHSSVILDISNYSPFLRVGGILCGHDYMPEKSGVMSAVQSSLTGFEVKDTIWSKRF